MLAEFSAYTAGNDKSFKITWLVDIGWGESGFFDSRIKSALRCITPSTFGKESNKSIKVLFSDEPDDEVWLLLLSQEDASDDCSVEQEVLKSSG